MKKQEKFKILLLLTVSSSWTPFYQHRDNQRRARYRWNGRWQEYTEKLMIDPSLTNRKNIYSDVNAVPLVSLDAVNQFVEAKISIRKPKPRSIHGQKKMLVIIMR